MINLLLEILVGYLFVKRKFRPVTIIVVTVVVFAVSIVAIVNGSSR